MIELNMLLMIDVIYGMVLGEDILVGGLRSVRSRGRLGMGGSSSSVVEQLLTEVLMDVVLLLSMRRSHSALSTMPFNSRITSSMS